ncbi:MAG: hypothetical protein ACM309_09670 [Bacillota bacterium]
MATIKVSFAELRTTGHYSNIRAEAGIEMESQDFEQDFPALWERIRNEVRTQLDAEEKRKLEEWRKRYSVHDETCIDDEKDDCNALDDRDEDEDGDDVPF